MGIADYGKALDAQIDLIKFYESPVGQAAWSEGTGKEGVSLLLKFTATMRQADPVYVSPDISRFIAQEMPKVPEQVVLKEEYLPFRRGFVLFDRPVVERVPVSSKGYTGQLRGLCWSDLMLGDHRPGNSGPTRGLIVAGIGNAYMPEKPTPADHMNQILSTDYWFYGERLLIQEKPFYDGSDSLFIREDGTRHPKWLALRAHELRRGLLCLFWFMNNRIAVVSEERPDRPLRRRLGREGLEHLSTIRLIKLRAVDYSGQSEPDHPGVNWSHRWWSREHQRVLYRGTPEERAVWVSASIKGPKDKPLIIRKDLIGVIR